MVVYMYTESILVQSYSKRVFNIKSVNVILNLMVKSITFFGTQSLMLLAQKLSIEWTTTTKFTISWFILGTQGNFWNKWSFS